MFNVNFREILIFSLVGFSACMAHYASSLVAIEGFHSGVLLANTLGFTLSVCITFLGHSLITFKSGLSVETALKFLLLMALNYLVSQSILIVAEEFTDLHHRISLALVMIVLPVISFTLSKLWVFKNTGELARAEVYDD